MNSDVLILGAGGAGLMCAIQAALRGRKVVVLDHAKTLGGKILISGGGRCNFTNLGASPANYVSQNPHFAKSALSRYRPEDFIERVRAHGIAFHEKKLGQLFCDGSARQIVALLEKDALDAGVEILVETRIESVRALTSSEAPLRFEVTTSRGMFRTESLVVATGGLSIPKIGATGIGYEIATQFGLGLVERAAALDGFVFTDADRERFGDLVGLSVDCTMTTGGKTFRENLLFTHAGLSGPATLQASLHWHAGQTVVVDLLPEVDVFGQLLAEKKKGNRAIVRNLIGQHLPNRLADRFCDLYFPSTQPLPQVSEKALEEFCRLLHAWTFTPAMTVGYGKAEVTRGGVDTDELSSKTLESRKVPGLFFIGEVVDVTGWLGGYNFQWAWASGWAAAQAV